LQQAPHGAIKKTQAAVDSQSCWLSWSCKE